MLFVFLLKTVEYPEAPPLKKKQNPSAVGKPHRYISTLSQWLKLFSGECIHLSLKRFSSSSSARTCPSATESLCSRAQIAHAYGQRYRLRWAWRRCSWFGALPLEWPLCLLGSPKSWTYRLLLKTCQSPVSLGLTLLWVIFKISSTPLWHIWHL